MKKYEVTEKFIKEAFEAASETWKGRIKKEFPELFEVNWEKDKWYKLTWDDGKATAYVKSDGTKDRRGGGTKGIGIRNGGKWEDSYDVFWGGSDDVKRELMTSTEIETMLWKEAEKRGIRKDTKLECDADVQEKSFNDSRYIIKYSYCFDRLWNANGLVYSDGKWATPLNENKEIQDKIDCLQRQLNELKAKIK